jgi:hypothetical protein
MHRRWALRRTGHFFAIRDTRRARRRVDERHPLAGLIERVARNSVLFMRGTEGQNEAPAPARPASRGDVAMALFRMCSDDPFIAELRDVFKANVLRVPETRMTPLSVLLTRSKAVQYLGDIGSLLEGKAFALAPADLKTSEMAALSTRSSKEIEGELGAQILSGLLAGMGTGAEPAADVSVHIKSSSSVRFSFPAVQRQYVDIARLAKVLAGRKVDRKNLLFAQLIDPKSTLRLVDSVLTASRFQIESAEKGDRGFKLDPVALKKQLANAKIEVEASDAKHLTFSSVRRLTFAFTCVNVVLANDGAIRSIAPSLDKIGAPRLPEAQGESDRGQEDHVLLTRSPEFIDVEFDH